MEYSFADLDKQWPSLHRTSPDTVGRGAWFGPDPYDVPGSAFPISAGRARSSAARFRRCSEPSTPL